MTYTSVVTADENPFKGMIFTDPSETTDGDWAKYGCFDHVDYTGEEINPEVFLAILSGDADRVKELTGKQNPKVMSYSKEDTLFTYFMDHGTPEYIYVGEDVVPSFALREAMQTAYEKQFYGKWIWFMEACYSGSMFMEFPSDWNVYILTSADDAHSANMNNCPPDDVIAGQELNTCLSGLWDNVWLDYANDHPDVTLGELYDAVKERVAEESSQNPSQFGDLSFRDLPLSEFFGKAPSSSPRSRLSPNAMAENRNRNVNRNTGSVPLDQVPLHLAKWRAIRASNEVMREEAFALLKKEVSANARREVERMRLGTQFLSEKESDFAIHHGSNEGYSASCVSDLQMGLYKHCGHPATPGKETMNLLRAICKKDFRLPSLNWSAICFE